MADTSNSKINLKQNQYIEQKQIIMKAVSD